MKNTVFTDNYFFDAAVVYLKVLLISYQFSFVSARFYMLFYILYFIILTVNFNVLVNCYGFIPSPKYY